MAQEFKVVLSSTQAQNKKLEKEVRRLKGELAKMQETNLKRKEEEPNNSNGTSTTSPVMTERTDEQELQQEKIRNLQKTIEEFQRRERKAEEAQREMKVMLDVYQSESKEQRDITEVSVYVSSNRLSLHRLRYR